MSRIERKIHNEYFDPVNTGEKPFEIRLGNLEIKPGDTLVLREWDPDKQEYTGRVTEKVVTCVIRTKDLEFWKPEDIERFGFKIIGLKPEESK